MISNDMAFDDFGKHVEAIVSVHEPRQAVFSAQGAIWLWVKGTQCAQLNCIGITSGILHLWRNDGRDTVNARRSPMPFSHGVILPEIIAEHVVGWLRGIDPSPDEIAIPIHIPILRAVEAA